MSQANILEAARRIAAKLETLPEVNEAFPYAKPLSAVQLGDLIMGLTGTSPPGTMGSGTFQTCIWSCVVKLGSGMWDVDGGKELQATIASLASAAPGRGLSAFCGTAPTFTNTGSRGLPRTGWRLCMTRRLMTISSPTLNAPSPRMFV